MKMTFSTLCMTLNLKNVYGIDPPKSALETGYIGFKARYFGL